MVNYIVLPSRMFCPIHKVYFDKGKSCSMCHTHPLVADGNVENEKDLNSDFTNNSRTITNKSRRVYVRRSITERFHSYRKKFDADVNWDALFKYEELSLNNNVKFKRINFDDAIVRVFRKSILVTLRSSREVRGLNVKEAKVRSDSIIRSILARLPSAIKVKDVGCVSSVHNAFVNHPFALKEVKVIDNNGDLRFISDNSHGRPEFEAVNTFHAVSDSEYIEKDMVSLIDKGLSRDFLADSLNELIKDREYYADNLKSHVQAINELSRGVSEFRSEVHSLISFSPSVGGSSEGSSPHVSPPRTYSKDEYRAFKVCKLLEEYGWGRSIW